MEELDSRWINASIPQEHWHFHSALFKRYGIVLAPGEFTKMINAIRSKKARVVEHRKHGETVFFIPIPRVGERVYVVAKGARLITVLQPSKRLNTLRRKASDPEQVVEAPRQPGGQAGPLAQADTDADLLKLTSGRMS